MTHPRAKELTKEELDYFATEEYNDRIARRHAEVGNFINAPQPEKWKDYRGTKYGVTNGIGTSGGWIGADTHQFPGMIVLCWTPYESIAQQIADNLKTAGWKYKDARVIVLNNEFLREQKLRVNTPAGFFAFSIEREDKSIVIVPDSEIVDQEIDKVLSARIPPK